MARRRLWLTLNTEMKVLEEGKHYFKDELKPPVEEKMLHKNPDPEESDNSQSKAMLTSMGLAADTRRDIFVDIGNPRQKLTEFTKGEDQIMPFDQPPVDQMTQYDFLAKQQVNLVIKARNAWGAEESKYDVTMQNQKEKLAQAQQSKGIPGMKPYKSDWNPPPTPSMRKELAYAQLMETSQSL